MTNLLSIIGRTIEARRISIRVSHHSRHLRNKSADRTKVNGGKQQSSFAMDCCKDSKVKEPEQRKFSQLLLMFRPFIQVFSCLLQNTIMATLTWRRFSCFWTEKNSRKPNASQSIARKPETGVHFCNRWPISLSQGTDTYAVYTPFTAGKWRISSSFATRSPMWQFLLGKRLGNAKTCLVTFILPDLGLSKSPILVLSSGLPNISTLLLFLFRLTTTTTTDLILTLVTTDNTYWITDITFSHTVLSEFVYYSLRFESLAVSRVIFLNYICTVTIFNKL